MSEELHFEEELVRQLERDPFSPFTIILTSGDRYEITEAHEVALSSKSNTVVVLHPRTGISYFRKSQIVAVDAPSTAA